MTFVICQGILRRFLRRTVPRLSPSADRAGNWGIGKAQSVALACAPTVSSRRPSTPARNRAARAESQAPSVRPSHPSAQPAASSSRPWGWQALGVVVLGVGVLAAFWLSQPPSGPDRRAGASSAVQGTVIKPGPTSSLGTNNANANAAAAASEKERVLPELVNQASDFLAHGKLDQALATLKEAVRIAPDDEDVHYNLGIALARLGKTDEAIAEYQSALRIFPDYAEVHNNLGNLLLRLGRLEEAERHLREAVRIMPDYATAWNNLGSILQRQGQEPGAFEYFQKAATLQTNCWEAHHNLGTYYAKTGRPAEARSEFETVLRIQPGFEPARRALSKLEVVPPLAAPAAAR